MSPKPFLCAPTFLLFSQLSTPRRKQKKRAALQKEHQEEEEQAEAPRKPFIKNLKYLMKLAEPRNRSASGKYEPKAPPDYDSRRFLPQPRNQSYFINLMRAPKWRQAKMEEDLEIRRAIREQNKNSMTNNRQSSPWGPPPPRPLSARKLREIKESPRGRKVGAGPRPGTARSYSSYASPRPRSYGSASTTSKGKRGKVNRHNWLEQGLNSGANQNFGFHKDDKPPAAAPSYTSKPSPPPTSASAASNASPRASRAKPKVLRKKTVRRNLNWLDQGSSPILIHHFPFPNCSYSQTASRFPFLSA